MLRRDFLKGTGLLTAQLFAGSVLSSVALVQKAEAQSGWPLKSLFDQLNPEQAMLVTPANSRYSDYQNSYNLRKILRPEVRALCKNAESIATCIAWCRSNNVPFAIRGGGHSYEGFSQSNGLVIDTRLLNNLIINSDEKNFFAQPGLSLGEVYHGLAKFNLAFPAGSCPTVGIAGHAMGGGFGLLSRAKGLACDSLQEIEMVNHEGKILVANENQNPDLFWASRGGGNGQFGVVTNLKFQAHEVAQAIPFGVSWILSAAHASELTKIWQLWAPNAPDEITSVLRLSKDKSGNIAIRCAGQSIGSQKDLIKELESLLKYAQPSSPLKIAPMSWIDAVKHFSGGDIYQAVFMKAKSDYLFEPMSDLGIATLIKGLQTLPSPVISVMMDSYGGAVNRIEKNATAFVHRNNTQYSIQYFSAWSKAELTGSRLKLMNDLYQSMRPYVSGSSYVNYCDLDLNNAPKAYWGENLDRLQDVKAIYDPENIFRHAQSILPKRL